MKKTILLSIPFLVCYCFSSAQNASIKGVIFDKINKQNLSNVSVLLLKQKDSVLYKFTRSDVNGTFELKSLIPGNYVVLFTHPWYEDYTYPLQLNNNSNVDIGTVTMALTAKILKEVTVRRHISPIKTRGDTTEYTADSFKVRSGASVEELLKKLPGIQVDKNGMVTAMGEKVKSVFVDGEEFFGDDPKIATRNLQADAIDKVQAFDRKSDQATFTGIDDGERSKTINLKLKENKKKGYFGKLDLGGGVDDKWNNSAMINSFSDKIKLSAYGSMSNTDITGSYLQQTNQSIYITRPKYGDDFSSLVNLGNNNDELNNSGEGLPINWAGGLNYSNRFYKGKLSINGSYRYNKFIREGSGSSFSQSILPDTIFFYGELSKTMTSEQRHLFNGTHEWQIDRSTSIIVKVYAHKAIRNNISSFNSKSENQFGDPVNSSTRNINTNGGDQSLQSSFLLRKKFKKTGRTISINLDQNYNQSDYDGFLYSYNLFFDRSGNNSLKDTTDQKKINERFVNTVNGGIVYTEPLSKDIFVELNYSLHDSRSDAQRLSFDKNINGKYESINNTFSNHYRFNVRANIAGVAFKYNREKTMFTISNRIAKTDLDQNDLFEDSSLSRYFTNFFPSANFTYNFNQDTRLSINYDGITRQPSINQIQPVQNNTNPLNITIGNHLLKQEFDHSFNFNLNAFSVLRERGIFFYGSLLLPNNAIVTNNFTDSLGRAIYQYVNTSGNYSYSSGVTYFFKLKKPDIDFNMGFDLIASRYVNVVNSKKNNTNNTLIACNLSFSKDKERRYNINYYCNIIYNIYTSSARKDLKTRYWTQEHNLDITLSLPWKIEVNNELQGSFQEKIQFDSHNHVLLWNAYFGKRFLKNDKAIIKIIGHDILNKNNGFSRKNSSNVIQETNYQNIQRYFLMSFVWNFSNYSDKER